MAKLVVNRPGKPQGEPIHIMGLGLFPNGAEYDLEFLPEDIVIGVPLGTAELPQPSNPIPEDLSQIGVTSGPPSPRNVTEPEVADELVASPVGYENTVPVDTNEEIV
jgi:hypothetical protein